MVLITYSVAQIAGPHFFTEKPYTLGFGMMMVCYAACMVVAVVTYIYLRAENARRDRAALGEAPSEAVADEEWVTLDVEASRADLQGSHRYPTQGYLPLHPVDGWFVGGGGNERLGVVQFVRSRRVWSLV